MGPTTLLRTPLADVESSLEAMMMLVVSVP
jgi:hypothetical protein